MKIKVPISTRRIAFLISLCFTLLLLELGLRMLPGYGPSIARYESVPEGFLIMRKPHARYHHQSEQKNTFQYNNFGFHDINHANQSTKKSKNIAFIGDSFLEGREVKLTDLFTSQLRQKTAADSSSLQIFNFGTNNTGTAYQYQLWQHFIEPRVKVDHVVLCFFLGNDLENNRPSGSSHSRWVINEQLKPRQNASKPAVIKALGWLRSHSALINTARILIWKWQNDRDTMGNHPADPRRKKLSPEDSLVAQNSCQFLINWQRELRKNNQEFSLLLFRDQYPIKDALQQYFLELLAESAAAQNVTVHSVAFQNPEDKHFLWPKGDEVLLGHLNEKGHARVADILYRKIQEGEL